jgi:hypothetical protein
MSMGGPSTSKSPSCSGSSGTCFSCDIVRHTVKSTREQLAIFIWAWKIFFLPTSVSLLYAALMI